MIVAESTSLRFPSSSSKTRKYKQVAQLNSRSVALQRFQPLRAQVSRDRPSRASSITSHTAELDPRPQPSVYRIPFRNFSILRRQPATSYVNQSLLVEHLLTNSSAAAACHRTFSERSSNRRRRSTREQPYGPKQRASRIDDQRSCRPAAMAAQSNGRAKKPKKATPNGHLNGHLNGHADKSKSTGSVVSSTNRNKSKKTVTGSAVNIFGRYELSFPTSPTTARGIVPPKHEFSHFKLGSADMFSGYYHGILSSLSFLDVPRLSRRYPRPPHKFASPIYTPVRMPLRTSIPTIKHISLRMLIR